MPDDLAQDGQVGVHTEIFLCAAERQAESGDDLVEDKQRIVAIADLAQEMIETWRDRVSAPFAAGRLHDDRSHAAIRFVFLKQCFERGGVIRHY